MRDAVVLALALGLVSSAIAGPASENDEAPESGNLFETSDKTLRLEGRHLNSFNLRDDERGWEFEGGYLNPSRIDPLLGRSPYFTVTKRWGGSGRYFDTDTGIQAGFLDLEARYGPDSRDGTGGTGFESSTMFMGSVLSRVGRAYHIFGPLDVGWSTMGLLRVSDIFPNLALDQTFGARVRLGENNFMGLFSGVTASAARMTKDWSDTELGDSLLSPHQGLSFWGRFPGSKTDYSISAFKQDNPLTEVENLSASLIIPSRRGPVALFAEKDSESGPDIEFDRARTSLGVRMRTSRNWETSVSYGRDDISFGNVGTESKSLMLSFRYRPEKSSRGSVSAESVIKSERDLVLPASETLDIVNRLHAGVTRLQRLLGQAITLLEAAGDGPAAAAALIAAIDSLDPELRALLEGEFGGFDPHRIDPAALQTLLDQAAAGLANASTALRKVADFLSDPRVIDRLAARYAREAVYESLAEVEVDLFGKTIRMSPPKLIAFAHAYGMGVDPILPVTKKNMDDLIKDECGGDVNRCVLILLPEGDRKELEALLGDNLPAALGEAIEWAAERLRQEANLVLLQVYLAAERLDALSIDRGRRIGRLNQDALMASFAQIDVRRGQTYDTIYPRLRRNAQTDLSAQDRAVSTRTIRRASAGLERLVNAPGWPKNVEVKVPPQDWPALVGNYGQKNLFSFIQESALKLSKRGSVVEIKRLAVRFDPDGVRISRDGTTTISLPPAGRDPEKLLGQLSELL